MSPPDKKIKIIYVIGSLQLGGAERQLSEIAVRLDKSKFDVEICCIAQGGPFEEYVTKHGVKVRIFNFYIKHGKYNPLSYFHVAREVSRIYRYFKESKPDIVHAWLYTAYIVGVACARMAGVPHTIASRRSLGYFKDSNPLKQPLENFINKYTDHVLVNSKAVEEDVLQREKIDKNKISLIYNGVDIDRFHNQQERESIRNELGISDDSIVVGVVANLIHYKGHKELIESARIVKPEVPHSKFVFVGRDGGMKAELDEMINRYGLDDTILFTGDRTDVPRLLQAFDIVTLASHEEGFSNVLLEAMANGKPIVATDVGGNPESVKDGETGIIVPPRNPEKLARGLLRLLKDEKLRTSMGEKGFERVQEHFSIERLIKDMEHFYVSILS
jgi:glycosyltransferase involved in cell wall biosynthesis